MRRGNAILTTWANYHRMHSVSPTRCREISITWVSSSCCFPCARVIHCSRNAIDTCLSCYFQNFAAVHDYSFKLEDVARYYLGYRKLMDHWKQVLHIPMHEVVYEQLVEDPDREIRKIIEFSGLDWDERCLKYYERRRIIRTASYNQANRPIYKKSINRWRNYEKHIIQLTSLLEGYI